MHNCAKILLVLCSLAHVNTYSGLAPIKNAIVQKDLGSRLGDRLLIVCAVKFLALTHDNLDFYYYPSQYIDEYMISDTEAKFDNTIKAGYKRNIPFSEAAFKQAGPSTLFIAPWSCIDHLCNHFGQRHLYRAYFDQLQTMVTPKVLLPKLDIPQGTISVAVHIRKGDGHDNPLSSVQIYGISQENTVSKKTPADREWPNKFPPEQYYIDQILRLENLLAGKKINFYIFSDSFNPQDLTARIAKYCANENTTFINASSSKNVSPIIDMGKIASCECLIRAESSYSIVAQIMGNPKIVFSPQRCTWHQNILHVERVKVTLFDSERNWATECIYEQCDKATLQQWVRDLFTSPTQD